MSVSDDNGTMTCFVFDNNKLFNTEQMFYLIPIGKIGDFGLAFEMPKIYEGYSLVTAPVCVKSIGYSAPEIDTNHQSPKTDVYSYGIVSVHLITHIYM